MDNIYLRSEAIYGICPAYFRRYLTAFFTIFPQPSICKLIYKELPSLTDTSNRIYNNFIRTLSSIVQFNYQITYRFAFPQIFRIGCQLIGSEINQPLSDTRN